MDKTKIAVDLFDEYAEAYQDKFMNVDLYKESLDAFCSTVEKPNASILELGCGPGNVTKYLLSKRGDLKILGTDLSENMLALAQKNNPGARFRVMDCRAAGGLEEKFDGVVAGFCLPYLTKEEAIRLIRDTVKALLPGGALYLSTMEDDYAKSGMKNSSDGKRSIYIHYHQADYLLDALEKSGFSITHVSRKLSTDTYGEQVTDLLLVAQLKKTD